MLDVRPIAYISPLNEQVLDDITPSISVKCYADQGGNVTGLVRIYRESTGLLIYASVLRPATIAADQVITMSAETPFSPGAPADDDYFIIAQTTTTDPISGDTNQNYLGQFFFDVKPGPMGPAPAAHAITHELGGMDQINVAGLTGLLATPQTPTTHATTHLPNGTDPIQPIYYKELDFAQNNNVTNTNPWYGSSIGTGTNVMLAGAANHPGVLQLQSSSAVNTGYTFRTSPSAFLIAGNEVANFIFRPQVLTGLVSRRGFIDTFTTTDVQDGIYAEIATVGGVLGVLVGKTANNNARSVTSSSYTLITNAWYHLTIKVNQAANQADFYLYDTNGNLLWHDTLTTNIPTLAGRETGHGILAYNTGTSAGALTDEDFMDVAIYRTFTR